MTTQRDQHLTENVLDECWHEWIDSTWFGVGAMDVVYHCKKCDSLKETPNNYQFKMNKPAQDTDFSTPEGFFKLIKTPHEVILRGDMRRFIRAAVITATRENRTDDIPDMVADSIYEFMKAREDDRQG